MDLVEKQQLELVAGTSASRQIKDEQEFVRRYAFPVPSPGPSVKTGKASDRTAVGSCPYNVSAG